MYCSYDTVLQSSTVRGNRLCEWLHKAARHNVLLRSVGFSIGNASLPRGHVQHCCGCWRKIYSKAVLAVPATSMRVKLGGLEISLQWN